MINLLKLFGFERRIHAAMEMSYGYDVSSQELPQPSNANGLWVPEVSEPWSETFVTVDAENPSTLSFWTDYTWEDKKASVSNDPWDEVPQVRKSKRA